MLMVRWHTATVALHAREWKAFDRLMLRIVRKETRPDNCDLYIPQLRGEALTVQGMENLKAGRQDVAQRQFQQALDLFQQARDNATRRNHSGLHHQAPHYRGPYCAATGWIGLTNWYSGNEKQGRLFLLEALTIEHDELHSSEGVAKWLRLLGELFCVEGKFDVALPMLLATKALDRVLIESKRTDELLVAIRGQLGTVEYDKVVVLFRPEENEFTAFAVSQGG